MQNFKKNAKKISSNRTFMKKKILFIINPTSGTSAKEGIPAIIERELNQDLFNYDVKFSKCQGDASALATKAKDDGIDVAVAVGGDGTVNEVARAIVHSSTSLGIIPCGSGNGLARHLMLPINIKKSIDIINKCDIHDLDYGIINNNPFFCTCGMGFDAFVSMKFAEAGKRGPVTYVENVLREGLKYKPETYEITDGNTSTRYKAFLISCANASQYGNNAYIAPQASMSDGLMDVIIMEPFDVLEASQISLDMFNKTLNKNSKIKTFRTKKINIHRSKPGVIHYDGDPIMTDADVEVELKEKGIKIVVNPFADKSLRKPNLFQSATSDLLNEINIVREDIKDDITKQSRHIMALNKILQRKLNL